MEPPRTIRVPAGRAAVHALRQVVTEAQATDPLAAVTVLVPSGFSGLSLRRLLASDGRATTDTGGGRGLANVQFLVAAQLAALLATPGLASGSRRLVSPGIRAEAVRGVLADAPGVFALMAAHPSTERMLDRAFGELRRVPEADLVQLAARGRRPAEVVRLYRMVRQRLMGAWYDEVDVIEAAVAAVHTGHAAVRDLGRLVVYCARPDDHAAAALAAAFGSKATIIEGVLDTAPADLPHAAPLADRILSVSDADDEARAVCREITALVRRGVPLHRIGVAYPIHTYGPLLHHHMDVAGIAHSGPSVRGLDQSVAGTALFGLLTLADHDLRRDDVMAWLASAPIIDPANGQPVPAAGWDVESRHAGVVAGASQWDERLTRQHGVLERRRAEAEAEGDAPEWAVRRAERSIELVDSLRMFVAELARSVIEQRHPTWTDHGAWAKDMLLRYLGPASRTARWPDAERECWTTVLEALDHIGQLDELGLPVDLTTFRRALERELARPSAPTRAFGDGVFVAPLRSFDGVVLDAVLVVGLAEGLLPGREHDDALLPERERSAAGPALERRDRVADQHRSLLAALACTDANRTLLFPRADLRRGRTYLPSRWLLDAAARLAGTTVWSEDLEHLPRQTSAVQVVASFAGGLQASEPASLLDRDLGRLLAWQQRGGQPVDHPLAGALPRLGRGLRIQSLRTGSTFSAFDGNVDPASVPALSPDEPLSATSLQDFALCPRKHLLGRVLRVAAVDRPEEIDAISASNRGTLVHEILEDYVNDVKGGGPRHVDSLLAFADRRFQAWEADGLTGRRLRWRYDQQLIRRELRRFAELDARENLQPLATEHAFGSVVPAVRVELRGGSVLSFKGSADRIDRTRDGGLMVTDYKTGGDSTYNDIEETTVARGTRLQLPIYGLAAQEHYGLEGHPVHARYWFISEKAGFIEHGYDLDEERLTTFVEAVTVIADAITSGQFPARPGEPSAQPGVPGWENCRYCEYDPVCPAERGRQWERKRADPSLRAYVALAEGTDAESADVDGSEGEERVQGGARP